MLITIRNTLFLMLFHLNFATSQTTAAYQPGDYFIDSFEVKKLCEPTYTFEYYYFHFYPKDGGSTNAKNAKSAYQILDEWKNVFKKPDNFNQSGFLTIRFIVNCHLEPCCFNLYGMDKNYQPMAFDEGVKNQLISFVKNLNGWKSNEYKGVPTNYFYYLNFTIQNGEFKRVSP